VQCHFKDKIKDKNILKKTFLIINIYVPLVPNNLLSENAR